MYLPCISKASSLIVCHRAGLQDVNVVRAFVMGLIASYGFHTAGKSIGSHHDHATSQPAAINGTLTLSAERRPRHEAAGGGSGSGAGIIGEQRQSGPVDALRPFLLEHAKRFWHELRCGCFVPRLLLYIFCS